MFEFAPLDRFAPTKVYGSPPSWMAKLCFRFDCDHFRILSTSLICKIYGLTQLSIKQLLLKIFHIISRLHVSARFYGAIFRLSF